MGFLVYAILIFLVYMFYSHLSKRRKLSKIIDSYISQNLEILKQIDFFNIEIINIPNLNEFIIIFCHTKDFNFKFASDIVNEELTEDVNFLNKLHKNKIQSAIFKKDTKYFFEKRGYIFIYSFIKEIDDAFLIFVSKKTSLNDELFDAFKRN
ncbi:MAG: hypothetical protein JW870_12380 [Candidatus Delongbacteria bacterium]|nr:hypothetical protein [Candidatus Delongbacteria bacterium]